MLCMGAPKSHVTKLGHVIAPKTETVVRAGNEWQKALLWLTGKQARAATSNAREMTSSNPLWHLVKGNFT